MLRALAAPYTAIMRPLLLLALLACADDKDTAPESSPPDDSAPPDSQAETAESGHTGESAPPAPGEEFDRFCGGAAWDAALTEETVTDPGGSYLGYISSYEDFRAGSAETMKVIPPHPFHVRTIRVQYAAGTGTARVRLMHTWGRSYPASWPDLDTEGATLAGPFDVEVDASGGRQWVEIDVSADGVFLLPTQHYMIVNEYLETGSPTVAVIDLNEGETSRALLLIKREDVPYGIDGNYNMELEGETFCAWADEERWMQEDVDAAFSADVSAYATIADVNGDGHQDVVTYPGTPTLWLGDGAGAFSAGGDPWPEVVYAGMLLFGDVDNDGDQDAFAANYVGADDDGDGFTKSEGDCDDTDSSAYPGATEETDGKDDDCDLVADDGTDTSDADGDGTSIADGDCDDTHADDAPGLAELEDGRDNDCDGQIDEDFPSRMLLNDGTGSFTAVEDAGLEVREPTTAAGFGDGNLDGSLDLYFGNWLEHYPDDPAVQDRYYEGAGDGTFTDALASAGLELPEPWSVYGVNWNDYNDDGCPDIFVGNYHLYDNQLWESQCDGTYLDVALEKGAAHDDEESPYEGYPGGHTYGGEWGDFDNDGDVDYYMANLAHPRTQPWGDPSMFLVNQGAPDYAFDNLREDYGFIYDEGDVNAQWADFDNDMDLDLAIASLYTQHYARVYRNDGAAGFTDITYETGVIVEDAVSVLWLDHDEDGDEDLIIADRSGAPYLHLYQNTVGQDRAWVDIVLEGTRTNRDGAGARVWVEAGGVQQLRDMTLGNGHWNTQKPRLLHFGLGDADSVDLVTVRWAGGDTEVFEGVSPGGRYRLVEGTGLATEE